MANFQIERDYLSTGCRIIAGVDEVGRGALFGPVVAASVIFPESVIRGKVIRGIEEIDDSKLLTPKKRKRLAWLIMSEAEAVGIGVATNKEIDRDNIYWASLKAMKRAIHSLSKNPEVVLVDGISFKEVNFAHKCIPQGDKKSISIASASIVAKVIRDKMMVLLDKVFSGYALEKNKGYGTREHYQALKEIGPTPFHRLTFNLG